MIKYLKKYFLEILLLQATLAGIVILIIVAELVSWKIVCSNTENPAYSKYLAYGDCGIYPWSKPHHYILYTPTPGFSSYDGLNQHNSLGYRGSEIEIPKPKGRIRIAVLGGSTMYETGVKSWKKDFARQLQEKLRHEYKELDIEVVNASNAGWSSWEFIPNLQYRLLDLDLDLLIVSEGTNEVHPRFVPKDKYKADNSGIRKIWTKEDIPLLYKSMLVRMITGVNPGRGIEAYVMKNEWVRGWFNQSLRDGYNEYLKADPMDILDENKPIYTERNFISLASIAKAHGIKVMFATWTWNNEMNDYASTKHYIKGFKQTNEVIRNVSQKLNIPYYDFESKIPLDKKLWSDGRHLSEKGVELKAKFFADFIISKDLLKKL